MATASSPTRECGEDDCGRPHRARGLCSTHYNQRYCPVRHPKVTATCGWCGNPCKKAATKRYPNRFCSLSCRDAWRKATGTNPAPGEAATLARNSRRAMARRQLRKAARGSVGTRWVAGICQRCGHAFVSAFGADLGRYCSNVCKRRAKASRRRARQRGAHHEPYSRVDVFERDGYRCHLCRRRTIRTAAVPHPRAPVIDHLIPLGPLGPDARHNAATACFACNSKRRDIGPAQLLLFG